MSKKYVEEYGENQNPITSQEMRKYCQRPGKTSEDGKIQYFTEQAHKNECNINSIIKKYDKTGLISHVSKFEANYGEHTGLDFKNATDLVIGAQKSFDGLPVEIKKRFNQSPQEFLEFMENEDNRDEAIKLGLINEQWTPNTDGLGEHVPLGENVTKDQEKKDESPPTT